MSVAQPLFRWWTRRMHGSAPAPLPADAPAEPGPNPADAPAEPGPIPSGAPTEPGPDPADLPSEPLPAGAPAKPGLIPAGAPDEPGLLPADTPSAPGPIPVDATKENAISDTLWGPGFLLSGKGERYNPDLLVRLKGWSIYERMLRDDQIAACLSIVNAAVSSRPWTFEITDQAAQGQAVDFLRFNLGHVLCGTVQQLLDKLLTARVFGFALVEKVYGEAEWQGRPYWALTAFKLRPAWSFTFRTDPFGNVQSLVQNQGGARVELDAGRFVHFVHQGEFDPHYGRSALVPAYGHWWSKNNVLKFWDIYLERMASGFLHGKKSGPLSPSEHASLQQALANLQSATSLLTPDSVTLQYVTPPNTTAFQDREGSLNRSIARALLIPQHLGFTDQGSHGSHAQAAAQLEVFFWWLDALCTALEDTINEQVIRELVKWNFGAVPPPRFRFERRTPEQRRQIAQAWAQAVTAGTVAHTPEDELRVRQLLDMPVRPGTDETLILPGDEEGPPLGDPSETDSSPVAGMPPSPAAPPSNPISTAGQWVTVDLVPPAAADQEGPPLPVPPGAGQPTEGLRPTFDAPPSDAIDPASDSVKADAGKEASSPTPSADGSAG